MEIKFWGTRGSIPAPGPQTLEFGGNTTCVEVVLGNGQRVVIDGGTGLRLLGQHLMENHIPANFTYSSPTATGITCWASPSLSPFIWNPPRSSSMAGPPLSRP